MESAGAMLFAPAAFRGSLGVGHKNADEAQSAAFKSATVPWGRDLNFTQDSFCCDERHDYSAAVANSVKQLECI